MSQNGPNKSPEMNSEREVRKVSDSDNLYSSIEEYKHQSSSIYSPISFSMYSELIKSKQTFLLVYTTICAYLISAWNPGIILLEFTWLIVGMFFAISGSTLLNMYIDRDIDALMERTKNRPLPSGRVPPSTVLKHGIFFTIAGISAIGIFVDVITMIIVFLGFFFDVVVYTILLKRRTKFSIIFGGIAGGLPAMAGRTAVIGAIDIVALLMGLFVLCWIPLHILTLALIPKNFNGYCVAKVPMWPVVSGQNQTIRVITISAILSAILIVLTGVFLEINIVPMLPLIIFCLYILYQAFTNLRNPTNERTFKIFKLASIFMALSYLLLFIGVVITPFIV
ncbi:MAG: heme o synthase [Candidatus Hodarchaeota archaeon]